MQKSTPISKLPNLNFAQQPIPVFDAQQGVTEQQNTMNEDITTIQDALDQLNMQPEHIQRESNQDEGYPPVYNDNVEHLVQHQSNNMPPQDIDMKAQIIDEIISWNNDVKNAMYATAIYIILQVLPVEKFVYKYVSLDKIPHSNVLVKAVLMFIAMVVLAKLL